MFYYVMLLLLGDVDIFIEYFIVEEMLKIQSIGFFVAGL